MNERTYHGAIAPRDLAQALVLKFNRANLRAQLLGSQNEQVLVQIASRDGDAALTVTLRPVADGVNVALGQAEWWGTAASLAQTGASALFNPWSLLGRISDIVEDLGELQLPNQVWQAVEEYCRGTGAALGGSVDKLSIECAYCGVANPPGGGTCNACGAPMRNLQPRACPKCGQYAQASARFCGRCGTAFLG